MKGVKPPLLTCELTGLAIFLEEELGRKVDVVPKRALREELRESVLLEVVSV